MEVGNTLALSVKSKESKVDASLFTSPSSPPPFLELSFGSLSSAKAFLPGASISCLLPGSSDCSEEHSLDSSFLDGALAKPSASELEWQLLVGVAIPTLATCFFWLSLMVGSIFVGNKELDTLSAGSELSRNLPLSPAVWADKRLHLSAWVPLAAPEEVLSSNPSKSPAFEGLGFLRWGATDSPGPILGACRSDLQAQMLYAWVYCFVCHIIHRMLSNLNFSCLLFEMRLSP